MNCSTRKNLRCVRLRRFVLRHSERGAFDPKVETGLAVRQRSSHLLREKERKRKKEKKEKERKRKRKRKRERGHGGAGCVGKEMRHAAPISPK